MSTGETIVLPGLVDMHVHLREPGATHKEDFANGTRAAIAGGVVAVFDMVNNPGNRTNSPEALSNKALLASGRIASDLGLHYGFQPEDNNIGTFEVAARWSFGLKSMLEISTGSNKQTPPGEFRDGWRRWYGVSEPTQPIILHAETETIEEALAIAAGEIGHPTHVAHISNRAELEAFMSAKKKGWPVTCGVTPHHLFMDQYDSTSWRQRMKPPLPSAEDQGFLWRYIEEIDVIETDHAPHTLNEKAEADRLNPTADPEHAVKSYGVPGLETMLPLLLIAYKEGKLTSKQLIDKTSLRPREILGLQPDPTSTVKVEMKKYELRDEDMHTKCGWTPFAGRVVMGKVVQVDLRGNTVFRDGEFLGGPQGKVLKVEVGA